MTRKVTAFALRLNHSKKDLEKVLFILTDIFACFFQLNHFETFQFVMYILYLNFFFFNLCFEETRNIKILLLPIERSQLRSEVV